MEISEVSHGQHIKSDTRGVSYPAENSINKKSRIIPAHTYKKMQNVGKKKSSALIQRSGWLRTLDMSPGTKKDAMIFLAVGVEPTTFFSWNNNLKASLLLPQKMHL